MQGLRMMREIDAYNMDYLETEAPDDDVGYCTVFGYINYLFRGMYQTFDDESWFTCSRGYKSELLEEE